MRIIEKIVAILLCLSIFINIEFAFVNVLNIEAEENTEEIESGGFSSIEAQILESERWCVSTTIEPNISLNFEEMWFLNNEDITFSYIVSNQEEIANFDYSVIGFTVLSIGIDSDDASKLNMELSCLPNQEEYTLDVRITVGDKDYSTSLFAINNEHGTFFSQLSTTNAFERYLEYCVIENILSLEEAKNEWQEYLNVGEGDVTTNIEENIALSANANSTLSGKGILCGELTWKTDDNGIEHPLRGIKVEIYSKSSNGDKVLLDTTITNESGFFSAEISSSNDVYIKIYAGDGKVNVGSGIFGWPYSIEYSSNKYSVGNGETVTVETPPITMTKDLSLPAREAEKLLETKRAFQISQALLVGKEYAEDMMEREISGVTAIYPSLPAIGTCYFPVFSCIALEDDDYSDWDVILHEYGHHIEFLMNIMMDPLEGHSTFEALSDRYNNHGSGTRMAWGESWNTVFGLMAQDYMISQVQLDSNINTVGDTKYTDNGIGFDLESDASTYSSYVSYNIWRTECLGDSCEESVMSVLWDLFDGKCDEWSYDAAGNQKIISYKDNIQLSHREWWNLTTSSGKYRFSDRANKFYELYADNPQMIQSFAEILTYYKMAPSKPVITNLSSVSVNVAPILTWSKQGGSSKYPNNSFDIIVYDESYNEILRIDDIYDSEDSNTSYTYSIDNTAWRNALEERGCGPNPNVQVFITVSGSRVESNVATGPYYSEYYSIPINYPHKYYISDIGGGYHANECFNCGHVDEDTIEEHSFDGWVFVSDTLHRSECECGVRGSTTSPHTFRMPDSPSDPRICIGCGYTKFLGGNGGNIIISISKVTVNGSYQMPDGTVYLVDADIEAYFNGTLVFYDKDKLPVVQ